MSSFQFSRIWTIIILLASSGWACQSEQSSPLQKAATKVSVSKDPVPSRRELARKIFRSKSITIVYGDRKAELVPSFLKVLEKLRSSDRSEVDIKLVGSGEVTPGMLANDNLLVIGSWHSNELFKKFNQQLPFEFTSGQFSLGDHDFSSTNHSLGINVYPNPFNPQNPLSFLFGNTDQAAIDILEQQLEQTGYSFFWNSWGYEIYESGERIKIGNFNENNWQLGEGIQFDFSKTNSREWTSDHFQLETIDFETDDASARKLLNDLESRYQRVHAFIPEKSPAEAPIRYKIYNRAESKGLATRNTQQAHYELKKNSLYEVKNELYFGHESAVLNEFLLLKILGKPKTNALLRGLSVYLTEKWQRSGYAYWAARLLQSNNVFSLKELLRNDELSDLSELVTDPLLASFVDYLIQQYGKENFLQGYLEWEAAEGEITRLEKEWLKHIQSDYPKAIAASPQGQLPYIKGFNFAHEGYSIYNGYGSKLAQSSLEKIKQLGGNTVAIIPYSYLRDPRIPKPLPLMKRAGTEDDAGTIRSGFDAHQLGMTTLLKPQIWLRGSWPGDIEMDSEEQWQEWMDYYYRWILHYALLAEMYDFDQLCIGVEFVKATQQRSEDWKALIKKLRGVYSGAITYAANWGEEFENIDLWDDLDYIGLNCYYPLGQETELSQEQINQRFLEILNKVEKVARKYNKPLVFTEIGFRNVDQCWRNPHAEANGRNANQQHQLMCYQAVADGIKNKDWCKGILWWKWPSFISDNQRNRTGFTPCGKEAEQVVKTMFNDL